MRWVLAKTHLLLRIVSKAVSRTYKVARMLLAA